MRTLTSKVAWVVLALTGAGSFQAAAYDEVYYSGSGGGYYSWDIVANWNLYSSSGGGKLNRLPGLNEIVRVSANTLAAEDGNALCVTNGVDAECVTFANGYGSVPGKTAWFRLDGGTLACASDFIIGQRYPGLATLESGTITGGGAFILGDEDTGNSIGTVTNNGATLTFGDAQMGDYSASSPSTYVQNGGSLSLQGNATVGDSGDAMMVVNGGDVTGAQTNTLYFGSLTGSSGALILNGGNVTESYNIVLGQSGRGLAELNAGTLSTRSFLYIGRWSGSHGVVTNTGADMRSGWATVAGYEAGAFGRIVHDGGNLDAGSYLQIGRNGGVGEFEANAPFDTKIFIIGSGLAPTVPGTGTVTVAENAVGMVDEYLRINNGDLFMRGGEIHLRNVDGLTLTNLFVRTGEDRRGVIRGWGSFTNADSSITLRMVNNGQIIADGEGVERELNFNSIAVVNNDVPNELDGANGWYAVNKGRLVLPRAFTGSGYSGTHTFLWGDLYSGTTPDMVNSAGVTLVFSYGGNRYVRGAVCAPDRSDIPASLPSDLRPIGIWQIGCFSDKTEMIKSGFASCSITFRYDNAPIEPTDASLRLYRHDGSNWVRVGFSEVDDSCLISASEPFQPLDTGEYNIGWFAVMAVERRETVIAVR